MAGRIPRAFVDELIARSDVVELIGARVPLKRAGREYKACCPFHDEKTASFWVSPEKQFYHCFGCGAHGTALGFLMEYDRLSFPEAVEDLAVRLGLPVPHESPTPVLNVSRGSAQSGAGGGGSAGNTADTAQTAEMGAPASGGRPGSPAGVTGQSSAVESSAPLYALLAEAASFFRAAFVASERARAYAARRGLTPEYIERFAVGYAPDSWNELLRRLGHSEQALHDLVAAGLTIARDEGIAQATAPTLTRQASARYYDRFRDRLIFPIRDTRGRVLGFGGRVLDVGEPKYLNSPETALFHKGRELYGLYETRLARMPLRRLVVVEGYMDALRLHQAGLPYAVATLGTATTPEHLRRAFRLVNELVFAFDGDRAGRAAAWRALQAALPEVKAGRELRFLFLPEGEDPDSLVGREGASAFEARIAVAMPLSEYLVAHLLEQADVTHADGKARFMALVQPLWERIAPGIYRELLLERIAEALQLPAERLQQWLTRGAVPPQDAARPQPPPSTESRRPASARSAGRGTYGRGSLITQAVTLLLHFPGAANAVSAEQRAALESLQRPGITVLAELLEQQRTQPAASMAQILERWRTREEYRRLTELAATVPLISDAAAAGFELAQAVERLLDRERHRRLQALIEKARTEHLIESEKLELQALTVDQTGMRGALQRRAEET